MAPIYGSYGRLLTGLLNTTVTSMFNLLFAFREISSTDPDEITDLITLAEVVRTLFV